MPNADDVEYASVNICLHEYNRLGAAEKKAAWESNGWKQESAKTYYDKYERWRHKFYVDPRSTGKKGDDADEGVRQMSISECLPFIGNCNTFQQGVSVALKCEEATCDGRTFIGLKMKDLLKAAVNGQKVQFSDGRERSCGWWFKWIMDGKKTNWYFKNEEKGDNKGVLARRMYRYLLKYAVGKKMYMDGPNSLRFEFQIPESARTQYREYTMGFGERMGERSDVCTDNDTADNDQGNDSSAGAAAVNCDAANEGTGSWVDTVENGVTAAQHQFVKRVVQEVAENKRKAFKDWDTTWVMPPEPLLMYCKHVLAAEPQNYVSEWNSVDESFGLLRLKFVGPEFWDRILEAGIPCARKVCGADYHAK